MKVKKQLKYIDEDIVVVFKWLSQEGYDFFVIRVEDCKKNSFYKENLKDKEVDYISPARLSDTIGVDAFCPQDQKKLYHSNDVIVIAVENTKD